MTARAGMAGLIQEIRQMCNAGTADKTIGSATYWTDDHIQDRIDQERDVYFMLPLEVQPIRANGTTQYLEYVWPEELDPWVEYGAADSGFAVKDGSGVVISSSLYTVNLNARRITFNSDQAGKSYFMDLRAYDLWEVAAEIWEIKAAWATQNVDWSSDNHRVAASQEAENCMKMAARMRNRGGLSTSKLMRTDEVWQ